ncbi:hypothetical protein HK099_000516 [Clydaea vesicula]|uniref:Vacuolar-sorting protein SNF7 n=1 Tax=Clydaea vesicula TaxID=447962 RepID=A0AAD5Y258_9FUNG|nr:hypothetical protein HK099_000516 [Clydaea vesicula]
MDEYLSSSPFNEQWSNDTRMSALFSTSNNKMITSWWESVLEETLQKNLLSQNSLVFSADDLSEKFKRKNLVPKSLNNVLTHLIETNKITPLENFMNPQSWLSYILSNVIVAPFQWGLSHVVGTTFGITARNGKSAKISGDFVYLKFVQKMCENFIKKLNEEAVYSYDYLFTFEEFAKFFRNKLSNNIVSDLDLQVCIQHFKNNSELVDGCDKNGRLIFKFKNKSKPNEPLIVREIDSTVVAMRQTSDKLKSEIKHIKDAIDSALKECQLMLKCNQNDSAKLYLKKKKTLEKLLINKLEAAETLNSIDSRIQSCETEAELLASYELGADALKSVIVNSEKVTSVMDKVHHIFAEHTEVQEMLDFEQDAFLKNENIDENALELELEEMIKLEKAATETVIEEKNKNVMETLSNDLKLKLETLKSCPDVPKFDVTKTTKKVQEELLIE